MDFNGQNRLDKVKRRIESVMKGPGRARILSLESLLYLASVGYGSGVRLRSTLFKKGIFSSKNLPCPVVSVGNIVAGGTGKTPMTICLATLIRQLGYRAVVISRGYRGKMEKEGGIVSDGNGCLKGAEDAGDEPFLMALRLNGIPIVVGQRRFDTGMMAIEKFSPDVIILDDAFQHLKLRRDLNLVLLDSAAPFGNGHLIPRGILREPVSALNRADAFILTRSDGMEKNPTLQRLAGQRPVFHSVHTPVLHQVIKGEKRCLADKKDLLNLKGKTAVAFSGLADNGQFHHSVEQVGCNLKGKVAFADHHRYDQADMERIVELVNTVNAQILVTTEKDYVKLTHQKTWPVDLAVLGVDLEMGDDADSFARFISEALSTVKQKNQ